MAKTNNQLRFIIRDRQHGNNAVRTDEGEVLAFSNKGAAKTYRTELNHQVIKALPEEKRHLASMRKQRFYVSPGPHHRKFAGGKI